MGAGQVLLFVVGIREDKLIALVLRDLKLVGQEVQKGPDINQVLQDANVKTRWEVPYDLKGVVI